MANVWSESDLNAFETTIFATGIPSLFGTVFLLGSALLFPELRVFPARMVLYLSIAVTISVSSALMGAFKTLPALFEDDLLCHVQSLGLMFGFQAGFMWFACIIFNLHRIICLEKDDGDRFERYYHILSWGSALLVDILVYNLSTIGPSGPWCMTDITTQRTLLWHLFVSYVPLFIVWVYGFIMLILVARSVRQILKRRPDLSIKSVTRLLAYGIVFMFCAPMGLASRVYQYENKESPSFILNWLYIFAVTFQGFFLFLLFGCTRNMYTLYKNRFFSSSSASSSSTTAPSTSSLLPTSSSAKYYSSRDMGLKETSSLLRHQ